MAPGMDSSESFFLISQPFIATIAILVVIVVLVCCLKCRKKSNIKEEVRGQHQYRLKQIIDDKKDGGKDNESGTHTSHASNIKQDILSPIKRLENLYHGEVLNTIHVYFELKIIENSTWYTFLNERLHELFHHFKNRSKCCKNNAPVPCSSIRGTLTKEQFNLLYQKDPSIPAIHEVKDARDYITKHCICPLSPNTDIDVSNLDLTLIFILIETCRQTPAGHPQWFKDVKVIRNRMCHRGDDSSLSDQMVEEWRQTLEDAVTNIASTISPAYQKGVKRRISELNKKDTQVDAFKQTVALSEQKIISALQNLNVTFDGGVSFHLTATDLNRKKPRNRPGPKKDPEKCTVTWKFSDPGNWSIREIQKKLECIKTIGDFDIEFVYQGSLIVQTTAYQYLLQSVEKLRDGTEEFLLLFGKLLRLSEITANNVNVVLSIWCSEEQISKNVTTEEPVTTPQVQIPTGQSQLPKNLTLIKQVNIGVGVWPSDCTCFDETFVFCYIDLASEVNQLVLYETDSGNIRYINMSEEPLRITAIDDTTLAVGLGRSVIQIIDVFSSRTIRTFRVKDRLGEVLSSQTGTLYVGTRRREILVMDLHGKVIRRIKTQSDPYYLNTDNYVIYYSDGNKLFCSTLSGEDIWVSDISMVRDITGITTDDEGNIYVTRFDSNNVVVVTPDGKQFRQLLSKSDGLKTPTGICYNKNLKTLMVCNIDGSAFLYKLEK